MSARGPGRLALPPTSVGVDPRVRPRSRYDCLAYGRVRGRRCWSWPGLAGLESLSLAGCHVWDQGAAMLLAPGRLGALRRLDLRATNVSAQTARLLRDRQPGLADLDLGQNGLGVTGGTALADGPRLATLRHHKGIAVR